MSGANLPCRFEHALSLCLRVGAWKKRASFRSRVSSRRRTGKRCSIGGEHHRHARLNSHPLEHQGRQPGSSETSPSAAGAPFPVQGRSESQSHVDSNDHNTCGVEGTWVATHSLPRSIRGLHADIGQELTWVGSSGLPTAVSPGESGSSPMKVVIVERQSAAAAYRCALLSAALTSAPLCSGSSANRVRPSSSSRSPRV